MAETTIVTPPLLQRLKAFLIDSGFLVALFFILTFGVRSLSLQNVEIESLLIASLWLSCEPLCVSLTGGSIGHHIMGLRVRRFMADARLPLARSYLRFFCKAPLGSLSLISMLLMKRHRAIHDFICRSVVVVK